MYIASKSLRECKGGRLSCFIVHTTVVVCNNRMQWKCIFMCLSLPEKVELVEAVEAVTTEDFKDETF